MANRNAVMAGALVLAGAAFWAGMLTGERSAAGFGETASVLVARTDLPAGTVLGPDMVETLELPRRYMQAGSYEVRGMSDVKLVSGLAARVRIPKGNQITQSCLTAGAQAADAALPPSQRHYLEGMKYFQNADYERARDEWREALKLDPRNAAAADGLRRLEQVLAGGK